MIVRLQFETALFERAAGELSVGPLGIEQLDVCRDVPLRVVLSVPGADQQTAECALHQDPSVDALRPVRTDSDVLLYQVTVDAACTIPDAYHTAVEHGCVFLDGTCYTEGLQLQFLFPDRAAFGAFQQACTDMGISLTIQTIQRERRAARADKYDVTDSQREVLELAAERGYFAVPRKTSLADLADHLDVSSQAVSERLRRGLGSLVDNALLADE